MFVPFRELSPQARLWVYTANREMAPAEVQRLQEALHTFCEDWKSHGHPLRTSFRVVDARFIWLAVDDNQPGASGCSIDGSVRLLQEWGSQLGIDFFDRATIFRWENEKLLAVPLREFTRALTAGHIAPAELIVNTWVTTRQQAETAWKLPVRGTWLARYCVSTVASA